MKKYIIYIAILAIGLLLGWFLFSESSKVEIKDNNNEVIEAGQMWTCSMHPQIMQPEAGDCPICGMDLIPIEVGADGLSADQFKLTNNAMALANIQTAIVGSENDMDNPIILSGKIAENEKENTVQVSYFSGRIEKLHVSFTGEEVSKGQLLATIYSPELYAAQQELITAGTLKESQPELYKAVRNKLKLWKLTENQINDIEKTGKVKENFSVFATVSGTVTDKLIEQGDYIKQGQPLLKIANFNSVWANFDVYENQIDLFKKGQEIVVNANYNPNKKFKAQVDFIDPVLNTKTRTVNLRVVLNNKDKDLKPGMFVTGKINGSNLNNDVGISIPSSAILWTGNRSVVYIKTSPDEPIFEMREIELGKQMGESYGVLKGLDIGDEIVTNGTFTIDAAAQLRGKKSMMNKKGGKSMTGHEGHLDTQETSQINNENHEKIIERIKVNEDFQNKLKKVLNSYIDLKDALVQEDTIKVSESANTLLENLIQVDMKLIKDAGHDHWMSLEKEIRSSTTDISKTKDIDKQRNYFKQLSSHLIKAIQLFGVNEKVYVEFCPMADNNNGAYWLSKKKKVINPYFGEAMLTCGVIKQVIE